MENDIYEFDRRQSRKYYSKILEIIDFCNNEWLMMCFLDKSRFLYVKNSNMLDTTYFRIFLYGLLIFYKD